MCTVTIILKGKNDFVLTSNRDEAPNRISLPPDFYTSENTKMLFPKDKLAGGTWIGVSDKNRIICLLNGGFVKHQREDNYRLSRGKIVKNLLTSNDIISAIDAYDLHNVEPFTLVIADWNLKLRFFELVWDGFKKYFTELNLEPKIWSSSTLYTEGMKKERLNWFNAFKMNNELDANTLLKFHKTAGNGNEHFGAVMDRGFVKTTSITQVEKTNRRIEMRYNNLLDNTTTHKIINVSHLVNE